MTLDVKNFVHIIQMIMDQICVETNDWKKRRENELHLVYVSILFQLTDKKIVDKLSFIFLL